MDAFAALPARARRKEEFIPVIAGFSFLGIMLGVATLIIVMAVMNGFRKELLDEEIPRPQRPSADPAAQISAHRLGRGGRAGVQGRRHHPRRADRRGAGARLPSPFNAAGVLVRGLRGADLEKLPSIANNIKQGTLEGFDRESGVAIGRRLANQLSLHAGDMVTLVAPRGAAVTPMGTTPRIKPYKIVAVFEIGMSEYDAAFVFMPLPEAQAYFNRAGGVRRDRGLHQ